MEIQQETYAEFIEFARTAISPSNTTPPELTEDEKYIYGVCSDFDILLQQNQFDKAVELLVSDLGKQTLWKMKTGQVLALLLDQLLDNSGNSRCLFPVGKANHYNLLGLAYRDTGRILEGVSYLKKCVEQFIELNDTVKIAETLCDIVGIFRDSAQLVEAAGSAYAALTASRNIALNEPAKNYWEGVSLRVLGYCLLLGGDLVNAKKALDKALVFWRDVYTADRQPEGMIHAFLAQYYIFMSDFDNALIEANEAFRLADDQKFPRDYIRAALLQAKVLMRKPAPDLVTAEAKLDYASEISETVNSAEHEASVLLGYIELELLKGNYDLVKNYVSQMQLDLNFAELFLIQIDTTTLLAQCYLAEGNTELAKSTAEEAFVNATDPDIWYVPAAMKANEILSQLNAAREYPTAPELANVVEI